MTYKVGLISLGCAKNLVDSEIMLGLIERGNYVVVEDLSTADILIVNTCGFIDKAKDESIDTILELAKYKIEGNLRVLIATGCLSERYKEELLKALPELDAVIGTGDYKNILKVIEDTLRGDKVCIYGHIDYAFDESLPRKVLTPKYSAYVKIGDGCNNHCTYCIIPSLRGSFRSRKPEEIKKEIVSLVAKGAKEIILIAQDTTQYGIDLYGKHSLSMLLKELEGIDGLKWVRLLYAYPENIDDELINTIKFSSKVIHYIDIPFQHTEDNILKRMARKTSKEKILNLVEKLRHEIPDIVIRSSFITGFPGESEEDFTNMLNTLKKLKLERLGVFTYSKEEDTKAALFEAQIDDETKNFRRDKILEMQQNISLNNNRSKISKVMEVLIEGETEDEGIYIGRTYMDMPEIDGLVYVHSKAKLKEGDFCNVKITDALEYDLICELAD